MWIEVSCFIFRDYDLGKVQGLWAQGARGSKVIHTTHPHRKEEGEGEERIRLAERREKEEIRDNAKDEWRIEDRECVVCRNCGGKGE